MQVLNRKGEILGFLWIPMGAVERTETASGHSLVPTGERQRVIFMWNWKRWISRTTGRADAGIDICRRTASAQRHGDWLRKRSREWMTMASLVILQRPVLLIRKREKKPRNNTWRHWRPTIELQNSRCATVGGKPTESGHCKMATVKLRLSWYFDEPNKGIDVGAKKRDLHKTLNNLVKQGKSTSWSPEWRKCYGMKVTVSLFMCEGREKQEKLA